MIANLTKYTNKSIDNLLFHYFYYSISFQYFLFFCAVATLCVLTFKDMMLTLKIHYLTFKFFILTYYIILAAFELMENKLVLFFFECFSAQTHPYTNQ